MMSSATMIFLGVVFLVWTAIAAVAVWLIYPDRFRQRIVDLSERSQAGLAPQDSPWVERVVQVAKPFMKLSLPAEGWDNSPLRLRFINAGWRHSAAPVVFLASKTVLSLGLPLMVLFFTWGEPRSAGTSITLLFLALTSGIGYYLPNAVLNHVVEKRQREIFESFPDALDLLTVCVEAGLGLDNALTKVAAEMHLKSEILAQELHLVLMELRTGFSKERALRNLALRTGVEDIDILVAMLIQSERFGTSMGDSLRVHSENLRTKRRQLAEEAAAKIALKLLFPLIFFVFPTLLLVLLGPAMMQIYKVLLPAMTGQ